MIGNARDFMHGATFLEKGDSTKKAADIMAEKNIGSVLIGTAQSLEGIVTERDILKKIVSRGLDPNTTLLGEIMTPNIVTIDADADIHRIASKFSSNSIRRLPVLEDGKVIGILTTRDITKTFIPDFSPNHPSYKEIKEYQKKG